MPIWHRDWPAFKREGTKEVGKRLEEGAGRSTVEAGWNTQTQAGKRERDELHVAQCGLVAHHGGYLQLQAVKTTASWCV